MSHDKEINQRLQMLLVDQATVGLDADQRAELDALMSPGDESELAAYMQTAALVQLGMHSIDSDGAARQRMPGNLRRTLMSKAMNAGSGYSDADDTAPAAKVISLVERQSSNTESVSDTAASGNFAWRNAGWAAAAALAVALILVGLDKPQTGTGLNAVELRAALLTEADDTVTLPWAQSAEQGFETVTGDVVWSDSRQEGYMRLSGLQANNPNTEQYQLWIIDPERGAQPVDGGVFDIAPESGEAIIPINAKLAVEKPVAFAITLEQPGGVVVSEGPLLIVSKS